MKQIVACLGLAVTLLAAPAGAQSLEEFYKGKTIDIDIGSTPGGGIDVNARLVGRYMGAYIPGNPVLVPKNVPGSASLTAANLVYYAERKDGTVLGAISRNVMTMPLMGIESAKLDMTKISWIGSVTDEASICVSWHDSPAKTWSDLLQHEVIVGVSAPGSDTYTNPVMLHNLFGAKFKIVSGYPDGKQIQVAMERREIDASCGAWSSLKSEKPDWVRDKKVNYLVLISDKPAPDLPGVPTVVQLAKTDKIRTLLDIILAPQVAGRPFVAAPEVPEDRKAALRAAFMKTMKDPKFVADAEKLGLEVSPAAGEDIQDLVKKVYGSPADLVAQSKRVVEKLLPDDEVLQKAGQP